MEREAGEVLDGRYRLVDRLGRGGFGDVWRAEELLPDGSPLREVALKLLHRQVANTQDWSEEARIIASLRHPALVTIYAAGLLELEEPCPFVAMELLLGDTLAEWVNRGERVRWRRALSWARAAAAALDEIHRAGVVHLDLKPANLFLTERGELKVLDFGISRQGRARAAGAGVVATAMGDGSLPEATIEMSSETGELSTAEFVVARQGQEESAQVGSATVTRSVVGTPGFMAPEVLEDAEASAAADAYALAGCVVQLTTGRLPQQASERPAANDGATLLQTWFAEIQAATVRGRIRELSKDPAGLPPALVALLERWLSLDPVARDIDRGSLRAQLDEVWACPSGHGGNPYRGLASYGLDDEGRLFGRDEDVVRISQELMHQPCVILQGSEGIGLQSIALAGVVPEIGRAFTDDRDDWLCCVVGSDDEPDAAIERAVERWLGDDGAQAPRSRRPPAEPAKRSEPGGPEGDDEPRASDSGQAARARGAELAQRLLEWAADHQLGMVLMIPALERLIQAGPSSCPTTLALLEALAASAVHPGIRVLATLREEYADELSALGPVGQALRPWLRFMGPPPPTIVSEIVRGPAAAAGRRVGEVAEVERQLREQLRRDGQRLPLMSLALTAWWDRCKGDKELSGRRWKEQGGVLGALGRHADHVVGGLSEPAQDVADAALVRLVASDGTAIEASREELLRGSSADEALAAEVLDRLLAERLIRRRLDQVRLLHPDLPDSWPRLHELRLHDMDRLAFLEELRESALRWHEGGRPQAALWRGDKLRELRRRGASIAPDLGDEEQRFITASRRTAQRARIVRVVTVAAVLLAVVAAVMVRNTLERRAQVQELARREAERRAAISRMVTRSRRTTDPYQRVALLAGAIRTGSDDPALPLELFESARRLPHAHFLTLEPVRRPQFPWGDRWLLGGGTGARAVVIDFEPLKDTSWGPLVRPFRPHVQALEEIVAFPFDSSFVTRALDGQLRVWRLRLSGEVALAAASPMRCVGGLNAVIAAEHAPVVACATAKGIARWDLRRPAKPQIDPFHGRLLHLSPDGQWIAAARLSQLLLWRAASSQRLEVRLPSPATLARFSPRDPLVAVVRPRPAAAPGEVLPVVQPQVLELYELTSGGLERRIEASTLTDPVEARWDAGGVDLAVCDVEGEGRWHYLRAGGRAASDAPPEARSWPCERRVARRPDRLRHVRDYGGLLAGGRRLGPREYRGGWRLGDGRLLTHDLVVFRPAQAGAKPLLRFEGQDPAGLPELAGPGDSVLHVERDGAEGAVWQVGKEVRLYDLGGKRVLTRPGHLLARCPDGRLLAWRKRDASSWELFGARHEVHLATVKREPAFFLGADPSCSSVFLQRIDGSLAMVDLKAEAAGAVELKSLRVPAGGFSYEGYVYDVRPSGGQDDPKQPVEPGLWLAFSSGAMVRLEGAAGRIRAYGQATPRATAMADGATAGQLLFADATGVVLRERRGAKDRRLLDPVADVVWDDLRMAGDGAIVLLAAAHRIATLDIEQREIIGELETPSRGRLAPWDAAGSVLLWAHGFEGPAVGEIVPFGAELAGKVAGAVTNLTATLGPRLEVHIEPTP